MSTTLIVLILLALSFDFINGFHDSANSVATLIGTGVLKPWPALLWAGSFNFLAFFIFPLHVAMTIGSGILEPSFISNMSLAAALSGAILFNLCTWALGLPSSSSHALIGGLMGVGLMQGGVDALHWPIITVILVSVLAAPLIGMGASYFLVKIIPLLFPEKSHQRFYPALQLFSSALLSLGHGGNDAQKTMGIMVALLFANGQLESMDHMPLWVVLSCYSVIALGTISGGWRIINTVAYKITALKMPSGACAEFGASFTLFIANHLGIPLSSTHVLTGGVVGVSGYNQETMKKTNWRIIRHIGLAWLFTFPIAGLFAAVVFAVLGSLV
jgi:PiT family inorganic phosphate transporter